MGHVVAARPGRRAGHHTRLAVDARRGPPNQYRRPPLLRIAAVDGRSGARRARRALTRRNRGRRTAGLPALYHGQSRHSVGRALADGHLQARDRRPLSLGYDLDARQRPVREALLHHRHRGLGHIPRIKKHRRRLERAQVVSWTGRLTRASRHGRSHTRRSLRRRFARFPRSGTAQPRGQSLVARSHAARRATAARTALDQGRAADDSGAQARLGRPATV